MNRLPFFLGALLHDIGKFIERAKLPERKDKAKRWIDKGLTDTAHAHRRYGADFIEELCIQKPDIFTKDVVRCALFHHRGKDKSKQDYTFLDQDVYVKMIRLADSLASAERTKDVTLKPQDYERAKLLSLFSRINYSDHGEHPATYTELCQLTTEKSTLFPDPQRKHEPTSRTNLYPELVEQFFRECREIKNETQLYFLLEKFLWAVPAQTPVEFNGRQVLYRPDVSLFDHSRVTAAIAMCLYDYYHKANKEEKKAIATAPDNGSTLPPFALLVQMDFSGIQRFIFNIPSKGAAKALKGRSFYLQLLAEVISRYLLDRLELPLANLLYDGGGNVFFLIPKSKEEELLEARREITTILAETHHGEIYAAIGYVDVAAGDFADFGKKWQEVAEATTKIKMNRFREIDYHHIFEPKAPAEELAFDEFTKNIRDMAALEFRRIEPVIAQQNKSPQDIFKRFGFEISFHCRTDHLHLKNSTEIYVLNQTDFLDQAPMHFSGFKFFSMNTPPKLEFDDIAKAATGDKNKLALLKMDVDNLGKIIIHGLPEGERSISRLATLSRLLRLFFEGYLTTICTEIDPEEKKIYVVYAGGDDTFIIGTWDVIFDVAERIQTDFSEFTCKNPDIHLSASLTIVHKHFPVIRAVELAEQALEKAKSHVIKGENELSKNKVAIFEEVFTWKEFSYIRNFKELIYKLIANEQPGTKESRALLQKIYNSTRGFSKLIDESNNGKLHFPRFWRFAYYLRDIKSSNREKKKELVAIYETLIKQQIYQREENKVHNPMIIPVATRWAELATKKS